MSKNWRLPHAISLLEREGWVAGNAEGWQGPIRKDFLGIVDVVAFKRVSHFLPELQRVLLVQITGLTNTSSRVKKIQGHPNAKRAIDAGARIEVWSMGEKDGKIVVKRKAVDFATEGRG